MEFFSFEFFAALLSIIMIDLVLAGDNAIVIGMAARNLEKRNQKRVIIWGTVGAIVIRALSTVVVVFLLKIPGLLLGGGLLLLWISYKLLVQHKDHSKIAAKESTWAAIRTIIIADTAMGMDNVIAVAGAAHGEFLLVFIGLLISIPIVVWGSTLFIKFIDRLPWIIYLGSGVLAFTAGKMITGEKFLYAFFDANPLVKWLLIGVVTLIIIGAGRWKNIKAYFVEVGANGQLSMTKELSDKASMQLEDHYEVQQGVNGKLVLVKMES